MHNIILSLIILSLLPPDIVYRSESCLSQATSTHRSGTSQASSDLVVEYMSERHANCLDTALPVRCTSTAVGDTETCHVPSVRVKKKSQGRRFSCCPKLPTVRIKVWSSMFGVFPLHYS